MASKIIGVETAYRGTEHRYLRGCLVRITSVIKGGAAPDLDPEADLPVLFTDEDLTACGGIDEHDRVDVQPWIEEAGRFSFVSSDPRAVDLACFESIRSAR